MGKYIEDEDMVFVQKLKNYINEYIIEPIIICFKNEHQSSRQQVKCKWIACANNTNELCSCNEVQLKNVTINGINYLNCDSFDFE